MSKYINIFHFYAVCLHSMESKTGVSVASQKGLMSSKNQNKKVWQKRMLKLKQYLTQSVFGSIK